LVLAVVPLRPIWVESWYSTAVYPRIERLLTPISNLLPFALLDVLLLTVVPIAAIALTMATRNAWRTPTIGCLGRTVGHLLTAAAALYVLFLLLWGLNYRRVRMPDRLVIDRAAPTSEQVVELGLAAAEQMNRLYEEAHRQTTVGAEWQDESLRRAFADVQ